MSEPTDILETRPPLSSLNSPSKKRAASPNASYTPRAKQARSTDQHIPSNPATPQYFYPQHPMLNNVYIDIASRTHSHCVPTTKPAIIVQPAPSNPPASEVPPAPKTKSRGRPKGSKNKVKPEVKPEGSQIVACQPVSTETTQTRDWTIEETSALFEHMLGEDADARFEKLQVASNTIWRSVVEADILPGRSAAQIQSKWETALSTFKKLYAFRNFTGRGADADDYDWDSEDAVTAHLANSHNKGCDIEGLSAKVCQMWVKNQWYDLFVNRFHDNPKIAREVVRSSADALSDFDPLVPADDSDDIVVITPSRSKDTKPILPAALSLRTASSSVAVASGSGSKSRTQNSNVRARTATKEDRLAGLTQYFEAKVEVDKGTLKLREKDAEFKRLSDAYVKAESIVNNPENYSFTALQSANKVIEQYLERALGV
ncbi:hypothetical protein BT96DRAFT_994331 [Gymnopus androsaceus JB14]|uniref:Myb-like domain-containing protein n=1 Tax=Gymnopus androsaceus JB14 TaxID=1447944 RepID=A0A6A4HQK0_9AGAR|nr:hypothetical protein BT96DRAFT_994331 [Gymnopus androsaceus JB14]